MLLAARYRSGRLIDPLTNDLFLSTFNGGTPADSILQVARR
jgi:hypothetical protein